MASTARTLSLFLPLLLAAALLSCTADSDTPSREVTSEGAERSRDGGRRSDAAPAGEQPDGQEDTSDESAAPETEDSGLPAADAGRRDADSAGRPDDEDDSADDQADDGDADADADADAAAPDAVVTCPETAIAPGTHDGSFESGGRRRTYLLHVPRGYTGREAVPLVFDFHGYGQSVTSQRGASGFAELADEHGFAVIYPAGVGGSWHVNGCCGQAAAEEIDEVADVRELLKRVESELCVDPKRIYASGISQGGGMAHHVACLAADVFAAVAPVSSDLRTEPCEPVRPISQLSFRGTADSLSAYEGGPVGPPGMQYQSIGAKPTLERWKAIDGCTGEPTTTHELCETYAECDAGVEVTLCTIPRGGHGLYSNPPGFNLAEVAWAMFERQRLP